MQAQGKNVLVAGDLNDFEFSTALSTLAKDNVLTNLWTKAPAGLAYSYKFNGHLQTLDHIFVTAGLEARVTDFRYVHFDNDYYERPVADGTGISDHDPPVVTFCTGKPGGGEDRRFVFDARDGALIAETDYSDKPFLYRLHSGEAFGDGGLVMAMIWGLALVLLCISGITIYWQMRRPGATGWRRLFW